MQLVGIKEVIDCRNARSGELQDNKSARRDIGALERRSKGDWRQLHEEELPDLYSSRNTIREIKPRRMMCVHLVRSLLQPEQLINPLALELDSYSLAHHLCKMLIFYEPRRVTLGNTRHLVEE